MLIYSMIFRAVLCACKKGCVEFCLESPSGLCCLILVCGESYHGVLCLFHSG